MDQGSRVCLAMIYFRDNRYTNGRRPVSFTYKQDFDQFIQHNRSMIYHDDVLVILNGGSHRNITLDDAGEMEWMLTTD